ncbi:MAG: lysophospholipid acyltransferase family protein [Candidatus Cryptobacteroides sp.]
MNDELYTVEQIEQLVPAFKSKAGHCVMRFVENITQLGKLNKVYTSLAGQYGVQLAESLLREFKCSYEVAGFDPKLLPSGPFITISNHPYGGVDGIALIDLFGHVRPDFKVMVNKILGIAKRLGDNFITVTPTGENRTAPTAESINGIKAAMQQVRSGGVLGLFPSGAVSDLKPMEGCIRDRDWQLPVIKLIKKLNVPVVPVRFFDRNSNFFYLLGLLSWKIRLLRLPCELFNKEGKKVRIGVGQVISPETINSYSSLEDLRAFLRSSVYDMPLPETFTPRSELFVP